MTVRVRLPANMRALADDQSVVEQEGNTVAEVLMNLARQYPELESRILTPEGELQSFVNVFVDDTSVRDLEHLDTPVKSDSEVLVLAALAGG